MCLRTVDNDNGIFLAQKPGGFHPFQDIRNFTFTRKQKSLTSDHRTQ